ncbi:hypothetical protein GW17_00016807 [Ensete ventricosum]|nr:hypothetical protein GW17_00016807 [Ensete ventricosum]RZS13188.1 hypothetical protein BHM03_00044738 [Ensete ventricosum]
MAGVFHREFGDRYGVGLVGPDTVSGRVSNRNVSRLGARRLAGRYGTGPRRRPKLRECHRGQPASLEEQDIGHRSRIGDREALSF